MTTTFKRECAFLVLFVVAALLVLYGIPLGQIFIGSFFGDAELGASASFVGLRNYLLCWWDPAYRQAFLASIAFTVPSVLFQLLFAFGAALLTHQSFPTVWMLRWIFALPYFLPTVVVVAAWRFASDPSVGWLLPLMNRLGVPLSDLRGPEEALPIMILVSVYEAFPFSYLVLLARLQQIPNSLNEVAELAGASPQRILLDITWPQMKATLIGLAVLRFVITFLKFDLPWLVYAGNGIAPWSDTQGVVIYRMAFEHLQTGKAYAASFTFLGTAWAAYLLVGMVRHHLSPERRLA